MITSQDPVTVSTDIVVDDKTVRTYVAVGLTPYDYSSPNGVEYSIRLIAMALDPDVNSTTASAFSGPFILPRKLTK